MTPQLLSAIQREENRVKKIIGIKNSFVSTLHVKEKRIKEETQLLEQLMSVQTEKLNEDILRSELNHVSIRKQLKIFV